MTHIANERIILFAESMTAEPRGDRPRGEHGVTGLRIVRKFLRSQFSNSTGMLEQGFRRVINRVAFPVRLELFADGIKPLHNRAAIF